MRISSKPFPLPSRPQLVLKPLNLGDVRDLNILESGEQIGAWLVS
jgi:hypothetical protein